MTGPRPIEPAPAVDGQEHHGGREEGPPVGRLRQLARHEELLVRIRTLRRQGLTGEQLADTLNTKGWKRPSQRNPFNVRLVRATYRLMYGEGFADDFAGDETDGNLFNASITLGGRF